MATPVLLPWALGIGAVSLVGGIIYAVIVAERKRREGLKLAAQMMGFTWEDSLPLDTLGEFPLFDMGRRGNAGNAMSGQLGGRPATIAEYSYVVSSGKSSHTVRQTVVVFTAADTRLPDFDLSPENLFHKLAGVFGYQDLDFERDEAFSKAYLLRGSHEEAIRRIFTTDARLLLSASPGWSVQVRAGRLLVFRNHKTTKAADLPVFAAEALRIAGALSPRGSS